MASALKNRVPDQVCEHHQSFPRRYGWTCEDGEHSAPFAVTNGAKQGYVLAPTLFGIVFALMLQYAFRNLEAGVYLQVRSDGGVFNIRRFNAKTKVTERIIREFLFPDDCALFAHSLQELQLVTDRFADAAKQFGLTISLKKTEILFQPIPGRRHSDTIRTIDDTPINSVKSFCYLGSEMSFDATLDKEILRRIGKASTMFGNLAQRLWNNRDITLCTKVRVYEAVVISSLLYGSEAWTIYKRQVKKLDAFHMRCLRKICGISWRDHVTNTEVLSRCNTTGIEARIMRNQLGWAGHLVRMEDSRIPKAIFFGQLRDGRRKRGRPLLRYKDVIKRHLANTDIVTTSWENKAKDRAA